MSHKIYELQYSTKYALIQGLETRGLLKPNQDGDTNLEPECWTSDLVSLVELNAIKTPAQIDQQGNEITPPEYWPGFHVDIMTNNEHDFSSVIRDPSIPKLHSWF